MATEVFPRIAATVDTVSDHPRVAGTRIRVTHVLGWLAAGMSPDEVVAEYPPLTVADIRACLEYVADRLETAALAAE